MQTLVTIFDIFKFNENILHYWFDYESLQPTFDFI